MGSRQRRIKQHWTFARFKARASVLCTRVLSGSRSWMHIHVVENSSAWNVARPICSFFAKRNAIALPEEILKQTACLHGRTSEWSIYMRQLAKFQKTRMNGERLVCKLNRSSYGQSGACWQETHSLRSSLSLILINTMQYRPLSVKI